MTSYPVKKAWIRNQLNLQENFCNNWLCVFLYFFEPTAKFNLKEDRLFVLNRFSNWILSLCAKIYNYAELFVGRAGFRPARKSADEANLLDFQTFSPLQGILAYCQFWFLEKDLVVKSWLPKSDWPLNQLDLKSLRNREIWLLHVESCDFWQVAYSVL